MTIRDRLGIIGLLGLALLAAGCVVCGLVRWLVNLTTGGNL